MTRYAAQTSVPVERSKAEIEAILQRYGSDGFSSSWIERSGDRVDVIQFLVHGRAIKFSLPMPSRDDPDFGKTPKGRTSKNPNQKYIDWEQACRQRWRALALCIKAKLEAVECKITTFESEFLAHIVDPVSGKTVGETVIPYLIEEIKKRPRCLDFSPIPSESKT